MKYLVAPDNVEPPDFCFVTEYEPLRLPHIICYDGCTCGCDRSFIGMISHKGTSVGFVAEVDETPEDLAELAGQHSLYCRKFLREIKKLARQCSKWHIGTRVHIQLDAHRNYVLTRFKP